MISVLLSTYNGVNYVDEQIQSILEQNIALDAIHIRDDGSTDGTREKLAEYARLDSRIHVYYGENLGYRRSFAWLLIKVPGLEKSEYIALSDQDDYWKHEKLQHAVSILEQNLSSLLYGSGLTITDEELNKLKEYDLSTYNPTLGSVMVRQRISGCTMVFRKQLLQSFRKACTFDEYPDGLSHDLALSMLAASVDQGISLGNRNDLLLHRRHNRSLTSHSSSLIDRIRVEHKVISTRNYRPFWAKRILMLRQYSSDNESLLKLACSDRVADKCSLFFNRELSCGIVPCDIESRLKIVLGTF